MKKFNELTQDLDEAKKITTANLKKKGFPFKSHNQVPKEMTSFILDFADARNISSVPIEQINDFLEAVAKGKFKVEEWEPELEDVNDSLDIIAEIDEQTQQYNEGLSNDASELDLFASNDVDLHTQMEVPIIKNFILKIINGKYNHQLGAKGWTNYYTVAAKKGFKSGEIDKLIGVPARKEAAREKEDDVFLDIRNGNWDDLIFKDKLRGAIAGLNKFGSTDDDLADPKKIWDEIKRSMK